MVKRKKWKKQKRQARGEESGKPTLPPLERIETLAAHPFTPWIVFLLILPLLVSLWQSLYLAVWNDDHFMILRYAENLITSHMLSYTPSYGPDEGASSILLVILIALARLLTHADLYLLSKLIPFLFYLASFFATRSLLLRLGQSHLISILAGILVLASPVYLQYSMLGVANPIFLTFIFTTLILLLDTLNKPVWWRWFLLTLSMLAALYSRPEGVFFITSILLTTSFLALLQKEKRNAYLLITLLAGSLLAWYFLFKIVTFGHITPPPAYRKTLQLSEITLTGTLSYLWKLFFKTWYILIPAFILFSQQLFSTLKKRDVSSLTITSLILLAYALASILFRSLFSHDLGRYADYFLTPLIPFAFIMLTHLAQRFTRITLWQQILPFIITLGFLIIFIPQAKAGITLWEESITKTPFRYAYIPAGEWMRDHLCPSGLVASSEVGAPAYYSERRFLDLSGLANYTYARIWRENKQWLEEPAFPRIIRMDPRILTSIPSMQPFYTHFFQEEPDMVFAILNPPNYFLFAHPRFREEYVEVWRKQRQDAYRGYYAVYARKKSPCIQNVNFSEIILNGIPTPRDRVKTFW